MQDVQDKTIRTKPLVISPHSEDFDFILLILPIPVINISFDLKASNQNSLRNLHGTFENKMTTLPAQRATI